MTYYNYQLKKLWWGFVETRYAWVGGGEGGIGGKEIEDKAVKG